MVLGPRVKEFWGSELLLTWGLQLGFIIVVASMRSPAIYATGLSARTDNPLRGIDRGVGNLD